MFSRVNDLRNPEKTPRAVHYAPRAGPDIMSPSLIELVRRSNGTSLSPQLTHSTENHQPYSSSSLSSSDARRGVDRTEHSFQAAKSETNRSISPSGSSSHKSKVLASCDALGGRDDSDPTKFPPQTNEALRIFGNHIPETELDHRKKTASSLSIDPIPTPSSRPSEPVEEPPMAADCHVIDDDPIYNIGQMKIFDQKVKSIPKPYEARWQVIRPDIFDRVHKRLRSGRFIMRFDKPKAPTIIELMSAGTTKECSTPAVVVVIPKYIKKMQDFLDTDSTVQNRCKPEDGTTVELLALACKGSSTLVGMPSEPVRIETKLPPDSDSDYSSDEYDSLNSTDDSDSSAELHSTTGFLEVGGQPVSVVRRPSNIDGNVKRAMGIRLITKDGFQSVSGTCGGFFQLKVPDKAPRIVGLMAGHLLEQLVQCPMNRHQDITDSSFASGGILYPKSSKDIPRYDWALFDAANFGFAHDLAEHLEDNYTVAQDSDLPDVNTVVVIRTSRGDMTGMLSSSASGIMLNPDQGFVHARTILMDKGQLFPVSVPPPPFQGGHMPCDSDSYSSLDRLNHHERRFGCLGSPEGKFEDIWIHNCNKRTRPCIHDAPAFRDGGNESRPTCC